MYGNEKPETGNRKLSARGGSAFGGKIGVGEIYSEELGKDLSASACPEQGREVEMTTASALFLCLSVSYSFVS